MNPYTYVTGPPSISTCGGARDQSDWGRDIAEQEVEVEDGTLHVHFGSDTDLNVEIGFVSIVTKENLVERDDAMEQKKYEITDIAHPSNPKWHRIRALEYIGEDSLLRLYIF